MGITHHSNYIKWMEEARVAFMKDLGWDYGTMEKNGIFIPVVSVSCRYMHSTTFEDEVSVGLYVKAYNGIRLTMGYRMTGPEGRAVCEAESEHCFMDGEGRIARLKKAAPDLHRLLQELAEAGEGENSAESDE